MGSSDTHRLLLLPNHFEAAHFTTQIHRFSHLLQSNLLYGSVMKNCIVRNNFFSSKQTLIASSHLDGRIAVFGLGEADIPAPVN